MSHLYLIYISSSLAVTHGGNWDDMCLFFCCLCVLNVNNICLWLLFISQPAAVEAATPETDVKKSKKKNKKEKAKQEGANPNSNEVLKEETNQKQTPEK